MNVLKYIYSPSLMVELEPYFRVEINGEKMTGEQHRNIRSVILEETENQRAQLTLDYFDPDANHLNKPYFRRGQSVMLYCGYRTSYESRGPFDIEDVDVTTVSGDAKLKIKARQGSKLASSATKRVITKGTVKSVLEEIVRSHGYDVEFEANDDGALDIPIDADYALVQTGETDAQFLQTIANQYGWHMTCARGKVMFSPPFARKSLGVIELRYNRADANTTSLKLKERKPRVKQAGPKLPADLKNAQSKVDKAVAIVMPHSLASTAWSPTDTLSQMVGTDAGVKDMLQGSVFDSAYKKETPKEKKPKASTQRVKIDAYGNRVVFEASGSAEPEPTREPAGAEHENKKRAEKVRVAKGVARGSSVVELEVGLMMGSMWFKPKQKVSFLGAGKKVDGDYRAAKVKHEFSTGFKTTVTMKSGWVRKKSKPAVTEPGNLGSGNYFVPQPTEEETTPDYAEMWSSDVQGATTVTIDKFGNAQRK